MGKVHSRSKSSKSAKKSTSDKEKGYCVRCSKKCTMVNVRPVTFKNGRNALKGKCSVCDCGMNKIIG
jgi:hypothetical protein